MSVITQRICDVCERIYEEGKPDWMVLSAPNAPEGVDAEWDFCSYSCLVSWITTDDEDPMESAGPDLGVEADTAAASAQVNTPQRSPEELAKAQARMDAAMAQSKAAPAMSLMEALASGELKFDRGPQ